MCVYVKNVYSHYLSIVLLSVCTYWERAHTFCVCGKCCCSVQRKHKGTSIPNQNDEQKKREKNQSNCVYQISISNERPDNLNYWVNCDKFVLLAKIH